MKWATPNKQIIETTQKSTHHDPAFDSNFNAQLPDQENGVTCLAENDDDEISTMQQLIVGESALSFWNEPEEDVYTMDDGEPL
ncbi:hypothetical protein DTL42_11570 [Bremerella cremea]|uniref:Uncharacterized protein n=1 Tax=Bremerella cremea TaxID=1031537 RepID=A0A368KQM5_9BACT|nr:hypothetical protein [Bremerella cremea]RCS49174.1 hypothetical protein DTL42_11570 [Bremerella cremea]